MEHSVERSSSHHDCLPGAGNYTGPDTRARSFSARRPNRSEGRRRPRLGDPHLDRSRGLHRHRLPDTPAGRRGVDEPGDFQVHVDDTGNTGNTDTTYTDTDVEAEARYVYRVKARNGDLLSPRSSFANAELPASPDPDSTRDGAVDLGDITGLTETQFSSYTIKGGNDSVDYFKFSITEPKLLTYRPAPA